VSKLTPEEKEIINRQVITEDGKCCRRFPTPQERILPAQSGRGIQQLWRDVFIMLLKLLQSLHYCSVQIALVRQSCLIPNPTKTPMHRYVSTLM
jgi:hypothetical protein